jgi:hypothetical protein
VAAGRGEPSSPHAPPAAAATTRTAIAARVLPMPVNGSTTAQHVAAGP